MANVRLVFDYAAFDAFRSQPDVAAGLMESAKAIADAAGGSPDFLAVSSPSSSRARAIVVTATPKAMHLESSRRSLTNALDAGRG